MADFYCELSASLDGLTGLQVTWLKRQLTNLELWKMPSGKQQIFIPPAEPRIGLREACTLLYQGPRCHLETYGEWEIPCNESPQVELGFEYEFQQDDAGKARLWIHFKEGGNLVALGAFVQQFLARWRPSDCWSATYANGASRPILGAFSGGALFVMARGYRQFSATAWLNKQADRFRAGR